MNEQLKKKYENACTIVDTVFVQSRRRKEQLRLLNEIIELNMDNEFLVGYLTGFILGRYTTPPKWVKKNGD